MRKIYDSRVTIKVTPGIESQADILIYEGQDGDRPLVIFCEPINPDGEYAFDGRSIINCIEHWATHIREQGVYDNPIFAEYLPPRGMGYETLPAELSLVDFAHTKWETYYGGIRLYYHHPIFTHVNIADFEREFVNGKIDFPEGRTRI